MTKQVEWDTGRTTSLSDLPYPACSVTKTGDIYLNDEALDFLETERVRLGKLHDHAFVLAPAGSWERSQKVWPRRPGAGQRGLAGAAFMRNTGLIEHMAERTSRLVIRLTKTEEGMLVADVRKAVDVP